MDVGDNIGAKLQTEQAEPTSALRKRKLNCAEPPPSLSDRKCAREDAGDAAKVVEAESLVPQAMADAFRSGNLGVMDYVRMKRAGGYVDARINRRRRKAAD